MRKFLRAALNPSVQVRRFTFNQFAGIVCVGLATSTLAWAQYMEFPDMPSAPVERPEFVFFPPNPPAVGVEIPRMRLRRGRDIGPSAHPQLRHYVAEPFYAPISPEYLTGVLRSPNDRGMRQEERTALETFDTITESLLAELRAKLRALATVDATTRRAELEALALTQADRLTERERIAEQLRAIFAKQHDWNRIRGWKLGRGRLDQPREQLRALEFEVIRAAAYFQDGLLPAQRRLLRELGMELGEKIRMREGEVPAASFFLSLLPETSRMLLPASLPDDLQGRIQEFHETKRVLKQELADVLFEVDSMMFISGRAKALEEFAPRQRTRLQELETEAEDLRRAIAASAAFPRQRWPESLPAGLQAELDAYVEARRKLGAAFDEFRRQRARAAVRQGRRVDPQEINEAFDAERDAELDTWEAQATQLAQRLAESVDAETRINMSNDPFAFIEDYERLRDRRLGMVEYEIAILEPGLSAAQRRLLFSGAISALHLPLPPAVPIPTRAPGTLVPSE